MNYSLSSALLLMLIGMITVFIILGIVVFAGNVLIRIVNRFTIVEIPKKEKDLEDISSEHIAVIAAVVSEITHGQGQIIKMDKK